MKICDVCSGYMFTKKNGSLVCTKCGRHFGDADDLVSIPDEITVGMIARGLRDGIVEITYNEDGMSGIACRISREWNNYSGFYFAGAGGDKAKSLEDYYENYGDVDEIPHMLHECIGTPEKAKEINIDMDEWIFYAVCLSGEGGGISL